jgi:predicted short-subunit dehydrogenase-like oxidoreductase (DUF2520 family)
MRELERAAQPPSPPAAAPSAVSIVGAGRLGSALDVALRAAGLDVDGPLRRGATPAADVVLLCVGDAAIPTAAAAIASDRLLGHCSGAAGLDALGDRRGFSLHPLMTVTGPNARFAGAGAAVDGSDPDALTVARGLAEVLGMRPIRVAAEDRVAYHAAASMASNFLVTLEAAAERLAATAGVTRADLVPLVRATVENWDALGPEGALTGPVARGDEGTVGAQRAAISQRAPDLLGLFDALVATTRELAAANRPEAVSAR